MTSIFCKVLENLIFEALFLLFPFLLETEETVNELIILTRDSNTYVTNRQMQTDNIYFTTCYYSPTCFGGFCGHYQGVMEDYEQYINVYRCAFVGLLH